MSVQPDTPVDAMREAARLAGSQLALVQACGLTTQGAFQRWLRTGRVPAEHVLTIERSFGVSRHRLRPDLYPPEMDAA